MGVQNSRGCQIPYDTGTLAMLQKWAEWGCMVRVRWSEYCGASRL